MRTVVEARAVRGWCPVLDDFPPDERFADPTLSNRVCVFIVALRCLLSRMPSPAGKAKSGGGTGAPRKRPPTGAPVAQSQRHPLPVLDRLFLEGGLPQPRRLREGKCKEASAAAGYTEREKAVIVTKGGRDEGGHSDCVRGVSRALAGSQGDIFLTQGVV